MPEKTEISLDGHTFELSNLDKVLFPEDGITKGDMIEYYRRIAPQMLPHLAGRPLSLKRYPDGIHQQSWFQKNTPEYFPDWIKTVPIAKEDGQTVYVVCEKAADLVYLANQATVTLHIWLSRYDKPDNPDLLIFDLDPSDSDFEPVREAAFTMRKLLTDLGLTPYVKTTGSRGLHVCCPLTRSAGFDEVHGFARDAAKLVVRWNPKALTTEMRKEKRGARVFVDFLRNSYAQTAVAPYSLRARPGAPVSAPISWDKLADPKTGSQIYNIKNMFRQTRDPWAGMRAHARGISGPKKKLEEMIQESEPTPVKPKIRSTKS
jgi:bifunctional non-homologous end joining protein LigD